VIIALESGEVAGKKKERMKRRGVRAVGRRRMVRFGNIHRKPSHGHICNTMKEASRESLMCSAAPMGSVGGAGAGQGQIAGRIAV